jgi:hypothetical protein
MAESFENSEDQVRRTGGVLKGDNRYPRSSLAPDADRYERTFRGVEIEAVQTGPGLGPNSVRAARGNGFYAHVNTIGFPVLTRSTFDEHTIAVARIVAAPPGTRWCGVDLALRKVKPKGHAKAVAELLSE